MKSESKVCQNCKKDFTIESEDFGFYKKINVPPPTWCPECRMIRRMNFRNERSLYKQDCDFCKKTVISMYAPENGYIVYCNDCFASDKWNPMDYGQDYDFSKNFFEQLGELFKKIPRRALYQDFAVNSEYTNQAVYLKNCYLVFGGHHYEDCSYCAQNLFIKNCLDVDFSRKSELCLDSVNLASCFKVRFGYYSENCMDSWLIYSCRNCSDCIGCTNLIGQTHCIFNKQYTKEEYKKKLKELNLSDRGNLEKIKKEFWEYSLNFPRKYANIKNIVNSSGDNLEQVRNCRRIFWGLDCDNVSYSFYIPSGAKDCFDLDHVGLGASENYELHSSFACNRVFFCSRVYDSHNVSYSDDVYNSENIFACAGLRKKSYCIFNKQYKKEEYEILVEKIKKQMDDMLYKDKKSRVFKYGEFFPIEIIPFSYNNSAVSEYFPLTKEEILEKGYKYKEPETKNYKPTILSNQLPTIKDANEEILKEIIQCEHLGHCNHKCTTAFLIIQNELNICKMLEVPLPKLCPNCRHMERIEISNPPRIYHRKCMNKGCKNEFETSYAPERPEIIYCDSCYKQEVY
ncbi:hypothetical protein A2643_03165 [Candidatus Nomurabacteria bacterium RIFCSPHIGHO2_01_FULL_39_220]|uniref:Zinc-binding domain-containing protein n=1 Tax=Candidatus Nomurabacteria bacterium RIFCSPLOWO2_02_FULL_40_67 TaxID=1801787 RepID=A0A1F6Y6A8_9BACT|nr:MAG: hypothetical protein UU66_C0004G0005 [Parcubacteria group bacterium GW2011_GWB1_41_5]OGI61610.1 MAG: hypothetical protein A2W12_03220 [Candidatus Nomurabacteria bacterium RBG_16_40_11]OGI70377.1 MAG: hypothetical protein A2643_03165 [Candidatus Nomurabacteria bacterium RIFCSPHIGHO2_01_FULL_39_220]OGI72517.1 MAG: hypothetical protein A2W56_01295 [Candidatus Nomurabacteria bacterium RIFCSPHIGHO2_02_41_18]OGI78557.1 MAG: hypothetical protein A3C65_03870 [Candidatus Nomurabacteria bacterium